MQRTIGIDQIDGTRDESVRAFRVAANRAVLAEDTKALDS